MTIACAVLILSGCCHDRVGLKGDWSIGMSCISSCGSCDDCGEGSCGGCGPSMAHGGPPMMHGGPGGPMAGPMGGPMNGPMMSGSPPGHHGGGGGGRLAPAMAEDDPLDETPHSKFHPVPTRPVFSPKIAARPMPMPMRVQANRPRLAPTPAPSQEGPHLAAPQPTNRPVAHEAPLEPTPVDPAWFFETAPAPRAPQTKAAPQPRNDGWRPRRSPTPQY